jgi:valyl-tRNA synthetase
VGAHGDLLKKLAVLEAAEHGVETAKPPHSATMVVGTSELFLQLGGLIDLQQERDRLEKQKRDVTEHVKKIEKQLHNPDFLANAPAEVVQRQIDRAEELRGRLRKVIQNLAELD